MRGRVQIPSERIRRPILPPRHHPRLSASHPSLLSFSSQHHLQHVHAEASHDFSQQLYERYREAFTDLAAGVRPP